MKMNFSNGDVFKSTQMKASINQKSDLKFELRNE